MFKYRCVFCYLPFLVACAAMVRVGSAAGGAALGSLGGPGTAAAGAAVGVALAETTLASNMEPQAPATVWEMISQLMTQAQWLAYSLLGLWLMTWVAPPPAQMLAKFKVFLEQQKPTDPTE